ncbi:hypothetical protein ACFXGJ_22265, partial [Rhodococcus sp. NPDC059234]
MSGRGRSRPGKSPGGRVRDGAAARRPSRTRSAGPTASGNRGVPGDADSDLGAASPTEKPVG